MDGADKDGIASYTVITDKELSVVGKKPGQAVLNLWFANPKGPAHDTVLSLLVLVKSNLSTQRDYRERLEKYYRELEFEINQAFPDSHICLRVVAYKLLVGGQARDIAEASHILQLIVPRTRRVSVGNTQGLQQPQVTTVLPGLGQTTILTEPPEPAEERTTGESFGDGGLQIVNLLRVPGEQQVELHVVVAEVNRTAAPTWGSISLC